MIYLNRLMKKFPIKFLNNIFYIYQEILFNKYIKL